jgi:hypothetical protein
MLKLSVQEARCCGLGPVRFKGSRSGVVLSELPLGSLLGFGSSRQPDRRNIVTRERSFAGVTKQMTEFETRRVAVGVTVCKAVAGDDAAGCFFR